MPKSDKEHAADIRQLAGALAAAIKEAKIAGLFVVAHEEQLGKNLLKGSDPACYFTISRQL